ncbi:hypothetical protein [Amycolatopsis arida]|uniref:hypothetical protein n=1 Tax=Amycolatopsis arida TaxID=587909 RepID=UPI0010D37D06|nr:hypothetical protein [Amycolatopsis arida]TDX84969.1 hypothetical protein CLV69_11753 [Amycolatopsis arida]
MSTATATATAVRPEPMLGESTTAPGLVIAPDAVYGHYTGLWRVVHVVSGLHIYAPLPLTYAREYAVLLARSDVDWARDAAQLAQDGRASGAARTALRQVREAARAHRPAVLDAPSVYPVPPLYYLTGDPDRRYRTWSEVVQAAEQYHRTSYWPQVADEQVAREDRPSWGMRCAALFCNPGGGSAVLRDWAASLPCLYRSRKALLVEARLADWTRLDEQHWLCPDCADSYRDPRHADL